MTAPNQLRHRRRKRMKHELAVLAAWLHDIGKFAQRAGAPASAGLEQEICPQ